MLSFLSISFNLSLKVLLSAHIPSPFIDQVFREEAKLLKKGESLPIGVYFLEVVVAV